MKKVAGKKLALNKETLRSLNKDEIRSVVGGSVIHSGDTCTRDGSLVCPDSGVDCSDPPSGHNRF